jgi:tetratricopeptide (TPR) repeat protein
MDWIILISSTLLAIFFIRAFTTFIHEMGHAIAASYYTRQDVVIFLGSYGNKEESLNFKIGKLIFYIRANPFKWKGGLCCYTSTTKENDYNIILAGPLASLLLFISVTAIYYVFAPVGLVGAFWFMFCVWSCLVFLYNIIPGNNTFGIQNGNMTYNDGAYLQQYKQLKKLPPEYTEAMEFFNNSNFNQSYEILNNIIKSGTKNKQVYQTAISACIFLKNFRDADTLLQEQIQKIGNINSMDRINIAAVKAGLGKYDDAIAYYKHLLLTGENNKFNLNNFAYTYLIIDCPDKAIPLLNQAIAVDKNFHYAYSNRAYAKMITSQLEDGKKDNDIALSLDPNNADAIRNEGIYHYFTGNYPEALTHLHKAKEIDPLTLNIDSFIARTEGWIRK